nr:MAG TPA: hypothetical protein [Caudoviricetes sp.]
MIDRDSLRKRRNKGLKIIKEHIQQFHNSGENINDKKRIGKYGTTPKMCSCWMCGNRRRTQKGSERLTIQERVYNDRNYQEDN